MKAQMVIEVPPRITLKQSEIPRSESTPSIPPSVHLPPEPRVIGIGDSILKGCTYLLEPKLWKIDAVEGRNTDDGISALLDMLNQWPEIPKVYIHLGTNGGIRDSQIDTIMDACEFRHVGFCTVKVNRRYRRSSNRILRRRAREGEFTLHDWAYRARNKPGWFYKEGSDLYHPKPPDGTRAYVAGALTCMGEKFHD